MSSPKRRFHFFPLEDRVLLSGEGLDGGDAVDVDPDLVDAFATAEGQATDANPASPGEGDPHGEGDGNEDAAALPAVEVRSEVLFVDSAVNDFETLLADLRDAGDSTTDWTIVHIGADENGIDKITQTLAEMSGVDAVHILSHGDGTGLQLGNQFLDLELAPTYAGDIASWGFAMDPGADLLIYGCDLAGTESGQDLIDVLAVVCNCDVAASDDVTGHEQLGGDWILEYSVGEVETEVAFGFLAQASWQGRLDGTVIIDQSNQNDEIEITSSQDVGQSFTYVSGDGTYSVEELGLQLRYDSGAVEQTITVSLRDSFDGTILTSATILQSQLTTSFTEYTFDVANVDLTDGQQYVIQITSTDSKIFVGNDTTNSYANGTRLNSAGSVVSGEDLAFRVNSNAGNIDISASSGGGLSINEDGGNDVFLQATDSSFFSGNRLTAEFQISDLQNTGTSATLFSNVTGGGSADFKILSNGALSFFGFDSTLTATELFGPGDHSVAFTWNGTTGEIRYYVDGDLLESISGPAGFLTGGDFILGQDQDSFGGAMDPDETFSGQFRDVRFFDDIRSDTEILAGHNSTLDYDEPNLTVNWRFDRLTSDGVITESVSGNSLNVLHTTDAGFTASEAALTIEVAENTRAGTVVGTLAGEDADREARIAAILAADTNLVYSEETGKFYRAWAHNLSWSDAQSFANTRLVEGVSGELLTIHSATEQEIASTLASGIGDHAWLGGTDQTVEGIWRWHEDGQDGTRFYDNGSLGEVVGDQYANWTVGEPDASGPADFLVFNHTTGQWFDDGATTHSLLIQWDADEVLDVVNPVTYSVLSQSVAGAFTVDSDSGVLRVADGSRLDYEAGTSQSVTVRIDDGSTSYHETFTVALSDLAEDSKTAIDLSSGIDVNLDGGNDVYFQADDGDALFGAKTAFTLESTFSGLVSGTDHTLLSYYAGSDQVEIQIQNDNRLYIEVGGIGAATTTAFSQLTDGDVHSLAVSWDRTEGEAIFYIDGQFAESVTGVGTGLMLTGGGVVTIANAQDSPGGDFATSEAFHGTLHDVRIWDGVRSSDQIELNHGHKFDSSDLPSGLIANWQMNGFDGSNKIVDVVSGNHLGVGHAAGTGFVAGTAVVSLNVDENSANGTRVGFVVPTAPSYGNDIVTDGTFANHGFADNTHTNVTSGNGFGDWDVVDGAVGVDTGQFFPESPLGGDSVDLNGAGGVPGTIAQTLATEAGRQYQVLFSVTSYTGSDPVKEFRVSAAGASEDFRHESVSGYPWDPRSFTFVAETDSTDLQFASLSSGEDGAIISDVRVIEIPPAISNVLDEDPTLTYDAATGKFYRLVESTSTFADALSNAVGSSINGVSGQLVRIDSAYEDALIHGYVVNSNSPVWLGASDATTEGTWVWYDGANESTDAFLIGNAPVAGQYSGLINNSESGGEDYTRLTLTGAWADDGPSATPYSSVIEWDAQEVLSNYSFTLTDSADGRFAIDSESGEITVADASTLDFESNPSHDLSIVVTGAGGDSDLQTVSVVINPLNDNPIVITSDGGGATAAVTINETIETATTVTVSDADLPGDSVAYSIIGGTDQALFSIDAAGVLSFNAAPDFETPIDSDTDNVYEVQVQVSDGVHVDSQTITVTVADVPSSSLTVTTTADVDDTGLGAAYTIEELYAVGGGTDGQVSLREAIIAANHTLGQDTISFAISNSDAGYTGTSGVDAHWQISLVSALPTITETVILDGTTQTVAGGDVNPGVLGTGGTVGTGSLTLDQLERPEIAIIGNASILGGLQIDSDDVTFRGFTVYGFSNSASAAVNIGDGYTDVLIEGNVFGADGTSTTYTGPSLVSRYHVKSDGGDSGIVRNNLFAFSSGAAVHLQNGSDGWLIENNELLNSGISASNGDGIGIVGSDNATVRGNLITGTSTQGIFLSGGAAGTMIEQNTLTLNGYGPDGGAHIQSDAIAVRSGVIGATLVSNVIANNYGAGIMVNDGASGIEITQNSFFGNGTITSRDGDAPTGQLGIDLLQPGDNNGFGTAPFVTLNDVGDSDTGGNALQNFPVLTAVDDDGSQIRFQGTFNSLANTSFRIEFFTTQAYASGHGQGEGYLGSATVVTDGSGNATIDTTLDGTLPADALVTATATNLTTRDTSEFGEQFQVNHAPAIALLKTDAIAAYDFESGTDSIAPGGPSITVNSPITITGDGHTGTGSSGLLFSGDADSTAPAVEVGPLPEVAASNEFSFATWARFDVGSGSKTWERIFDFGGGPLEDNVLLSRFVGTNDLSLYVYDGNVVQSTIVITDALLGIEGTWNHYGVTIDSAGEVNLYINGQLVGSDQADSLPDYSTWDQNYIGYSQITTNRRFQGAIDDIGIFDRAISAAEMAALAQTSTPQTYSVLENSTNGTSVAFVPGAEIDTGDSPTYSLTDNASGRFVIDGSTGEITVLDGSLLNFENNTSHDVTVRLSDGTVFDEQTLTIEVVNVNEAPVVVSPGSAFSATEQVGLDIHGTGFSVTDVDNPSGTAIATLAVGEGQIVISEGDSGITLLSGNHTDNVTFRGTTAQINDLLTGAGTGTIVYTANSDTPSTSTTITVRVNDLGNSGVDPGTTGNETSEEGIATETINIQRVNDTPHLLGPELVTNGDFSAGLSDWTTSGAVDISSSTLRFGTGDAAGAHSASQTITTVAGQQYSLAFDYYDDTTSDNQSLQVSIDGASNLLTTSQIVTDLFGTTAIRYHYSFTADSAATTITFTDTSDTAGISDDTVGVDGYLDHVSVKQSGGVLGTVLYTEGTDPVVLHDSIVFQDLEIEASNDNYAGVDLVLHRNGGAHANDQFVASGNLSALTESGNLVLSGATIGTVVTNSGGELAIRFNSTASTATVNETLQSIAYHNLSDTPPSSVQIDWQIEDANGTAQGSGGNFVIVASTVVNLQNAADLEITAPSSVTTNEDTALVYSGANLIQIDDGIGADQRVQVSLEVGNGSLTLSGVTGILFVEGNDGDGSFVIEGLQSDVNNALDGLSFSPDADHYGADTLTIQTSIAANLEGHYTFDDTTADDQSAGTAHHGSFVGTATTLTDGIRGEVLSLTATGDNVEIASNFETPANVTLAAWVNLNSAGTAGSEVITIGGQLILRLDSSIGVQAAYNDGSTYQTLGSGTNLAGTGWRHVAFSFDDAGNTQRLYVDGQIVAETNDASSIAYGGNSTTRIGKHLVNNLFDFNGLIDDARIYQRALTADEVAALANDEASVTENVAITINAVNDAPNAIVLGHGPNLITNGSFESGLASWNPTGNVVSASYAAVVDGSTAAAFGAGDSPATGVISQDITTVVGETYTLRFDYWGLKAFPNGTEQSLQVEVIGATSLIDSEVQAVAHNSLSSVTLNGNHSFTFVADSTTTTIAFSDTSTETIALDGFLDDIRLYESPSTLSVVENSSNGTFVGAAAGLDVDGNDRFIYSLDDNAGGRFAIDDRTGQITVLDGTLLDRENDLFHDITVRFEDDAGQAITETFTINVNEVNVSPVITSDGGGDNAAINAIETIDFVTTVAATDINLPGDTITYSIAGGTDAGAFSIDSSTGELTFDAAPDYESPVDSDGNNIYEVIVVASDGSLSDSQTILVTVLDASATNLTVTTTADTDDVGLANYTIEQLNARGGGTDGLVSLREAVAAANFTAGIDNITFNISTSDAGYVDPDAIAANGDEYWTITRNSTLTITDTLNLDARTQATYTDSPVIRLQNSTGNNTGLRLENHTGSTVAGFAITDFSAGIFATGGGSHAIVGNYVGVAPDGTTAPGNLLAGIVLFSSTNVTIGDTGITNRNVISGNGTEGIYATGTSSGLTIQNNYIGISASGTVDLGNGTGIALDNVDGAIIGTDADGSNDALEGNLIAGNTTGISLSGDNHVIAGNVFGVTGMTQNQGLVFTGASAGNLIGGTAADTANEFAFHAAEAIFVSTDATTAGQILGNTFHDNGGLPIDLDGTGANDGVLVGSGQGNQGMDSPTITLANLDGTTLELDGYVGSAPNQSTFAGSRVEFFRSAAGEADEFLGFLTTDANGLFSGSLTVSGLTHSDTLIATATAAAGYTSEFGATRDVNADPNLTTITSGPPNFTEGNSGTFVDPNATLTDLDGVDFDGGTLSLTIASGGTSEDTLRVEPNGTGTGEISLSGNDLIRDGQTIATTSGGIGHGNPLVISFNANADADDVQAVLRLVVFENSSDDPTADVRQIEVVVTDGDGGTSDTSTRAISINATNDAPVATDDAGIAYHPSAIGYWNFGETSGTTATDTVSGNDGTYVGASLGVAGSPGGGDTAVSFDGNSYVEIAHDPAFLIDEGTIQLWFKTSDVTEKAGLISKDASGNGTGGHLYVGLTNSGALEYRIQSINSSHSVLTNATNQPISENQWHHLAVTFGTGGLNLYLDGVLLRTNSYQGGLGTSSGGIGNEETLVVGANNNNGSVEDGFVGELDEFAIIDEQFDAAQIAALYQFRSGVQSVDEGGDLVIDLAANDFDVDDGLDLSSINVVSGPSHGSLIVHGDGTVTYQHDGSETSSDSFTYTIDDASGATSNVATALIAISPVNDAPSGTDQTVSTAEDTDYVFASTDFGFTDAAENDGLAAVHFTAGPTAGVLYLDANDDGVVDGGESITSAAAVTIAQIDAGQLKFRAAADEVGSPYATFTFQVQDDGGTANGGIDTDASANLITVDVLAVNDAPTSIVVGDGPNLISDGSFENGLDDWTVSGNATSGSGSPAVDGSLAVVFGVGGTPATGVVSQDITTVIGQTYTLRFDHWGFRPFNDGTLQSIQVQAIGSATLLDESVQSVGHDSTGGVTLNSNHSFTFVADSTSTTIQFSDTSLVSTSIDGYLDDVRVYEATPSLSVDENSANGTFVGAAAGRDPDQNDRFVYSLDDNAGGRFTIDGRTGEITVLNGSTLDRETDTSHDITVRFEDAAGQATTETFTVNVADLNEAPTITSDGGGDNAAINVNETIEFVTTVTVTDVDLPGDTITYSIAGGTDAGDFSIDSSTGELTFSSPPDYEAPVDSDGNNVYEVIVVASDGSLSDSQTLTVSVIDVSATSLVVTTTADVDDVGFSGYTIEQLNAVGGGTDGEVSLREAILAANQTAGADSISFQIDTSDAGYVDPDTIAASGDEYWTIAPTSALPTIDDAVTIDATTQPTFGSHPVIELDGTSSGGGSGLILGSGSDGSEIRGFAIHSFDQAITLQNSGSHTVAGNYIGSDVTGLVGHGNTAQGIHFSNSGDNLLGGTDAADRNLIVSSGWVGIFADGAGSTGNTIAGNWIGLASDGETALGNVSSGIRLVTGGNTIGIAGAGNVISGNSHGIVLTETADGNVVSANRIGTNVAGDTRVANTFEGIAVLSDNNVIGSNLDGTDDALEGNLIAGIQSGITIGNASGNSVAGNFIGTNGVDLLGNNFSGVLLVGVSTGNTIGGTAAHAGNVISGNDVGVNLIGSDVTGNTVLGNTIGLNAAGDAAIANNIGIHLDGSGANVIGAVGAGNLIAGNLSQGIRVESSTGITILANQIGTAAFGNGTHGIEIQAGSSNVVVGGTGAGQGNTIVGNAGAAIHVSADSTAAGSFLGNEFRDSATLIELNGGVAPGNDNVTNPAESNHGMDSPTIQLAQLDGGNLTLDGFIGTGGGSTDFDSSRVEFYQSSGDDAIYLGFLIADANGLFSGTIATPGLTVADSVVAVATSQAGFTGQFGGVQAVNVDPVLTLVTPTRTYVENALSVAIADDATLTDADGADFEGAVLTATLTSGASIHDRLLIHTTSSPQVNSVFDGGNAQVGVSYQGTLIGSVAGGLNGATPLTITFNSDATAAGVEAVLRIISFRTLGDDPTTGDRTIEISITDGDGGTSLTESVTVSIQAENDPPTIATSAIHEDFEGGATGWTNNTTTVDPNLTEVLGQFNAVQSATPIEKTFSISGDTDQTVITFDFIEFDSWDAERFQIYINDVLVAQPLFQWLSGGGIQSGSVGDVSWTATPLDPGESNQAGEPGRTDQVHRFEIIVDNPTPSLKLGFNSTLNGTNLFDESWGIDNLTLRNFGSTLAYREGDGNVAFLPASLAIADEDDSQLESAVIQFESGFVPSEDSLGFTDQNGITGTWDAVNGILSLDGTASVADYQAAIGSITFSNGDVSPTAGSRELSIIVHDGTSDSDPLTAHIEVTSVNSEQTIVNNLELDIDENSLGNVITASLLQVTDVDHPSDEIVFTITDAADHGSLYLDSTALSLNDTFTQEDIDLGRITYHHDGSETSSDGFTFSVDDGLGNASSGTFAINIAPVNDQTPIVTSDGGAATAAIDVDENQTAVTTVTAADGDLPAETLEFSIVGGDDSGHFSIDDSTGALVFLVAKDREAATDNDGDSVYEVIVQVSDGTHSSVQAIDVSINDVNESSVTVPVDVNAAVNQVLENAANAVVGITANATDADATTSGITYRLSDNVDGLFQIHGTTGVVTTAVAIDREVHGATRSITVEAESLDGSTQTQVFTIAVLDIDEFDVAAAGDSDPTANQVNENASFGSATGLQVSAIDADATQSLVTHVLTDSAGGRFEINTATGVVTVAAGADLDFEDQSSHSIQVRSTSEDGSFVDQSYTIMVVDQNEAPVANTEGFQTLAGSPLESAPLGALDNDTDPDNDDLTAVLRSPPSNGSLTLNADGTFTYTPVAGFFGLDSFTYVANDGGLDSNEVIVWINVIAMAGGGDGGGDGDGGEPLDPAVGEPEPPPATATAEDSGTLGVQSIDLEREDYHPTHEQSHVEPESLAVNQVGAAGAADESAVGALNSSIASVRRGLTSVNTLGALPGGTLERLVMNQFTPKLNSIDQWKAHAAFVWDSTTSDVEDTEENESLSFLVDSASTAAGLFSIGVVVWILRGGALMTALASGGSSWRIVDPNAMLSAYRGGGNRLSSGGGIDSMID